MIDISGEREARILNELSLVVGLTKIDAISGKFWGRAALEEKDKVGETMDYEKSKPYFASLRKEFQDATDGKSSASIRVMHTKQVAGVATELLLNDLEKAVDIEGEVIDPIQKELLIKGAYTGLSIGGTKRMIQGENGEKRYIAMPSEISLVDNPAMYGARIMVKYADHEEEVVLGEKTSSKEEALVEYLTKSLGIKAEYHEMSVEKRKEFCENSVNEIDVLLTKSFNDLDVELRLDPEGDEEMDEKALEELKKSYDDKVETLEKAYDAKLADAVKPLTEDLAAVKTSLEKFDGVEDALEKLNTAVETIAEKFGDLPEPPKGVRALSKEADTAIKEGNEEEEEEEEENLEKAHDPAKAAAAMKKINKVVI